MLNYKQSLIGFHNPYTMKGWSPFEFLDKYIAFLENGSRKKDGTDRFKLARWIKRHYDMQLSYVKRLFPKTLRA